LARQKKDQTDSGKKKDKKYDSQINNIANSAVSRLQSEKLKNGIDMSRQYIETVQDQDGNTTINRPIKMASGINKIKDAGLRRDIRTGHFEGTPQDDNIGLKTKKIMQKEDYMQLQQYPRSGKTNTFMNQGANKHKRDDYDKI